MISLLYQFLLMERDAHLARNSTIRKLLKISLKSCCLYSARLFITSMCLKGLLNFVFWGRSEKFAFNYNSLKCFISIEIRSSNRKAE